MKNYIEKNYIEREPNRELTIYEMLDPSRAINTIVNGRLHQSWTYKGKWIAGHVHLDPPYEDEAEKEREFEELKAVLREIGEIY